MPNWTFIRETGSLKWVTRYAAYQFQKRALRQDSRLLLPTGLRMYLDRRSGSSAEVYVTGANMDWGSEALFAQFADPQRDFLDIGAHIGYYAMYISPLVRRAYAFEPSELNHSALKKNARLAHNIEVVPMAVSSSTGTSLFYCGKGSAVGSLNPQEGLTFTVPITTVDSFARAHALDPALIKTDIEGHDLEALRGMEHTVEQFQPLLLTECELTSELMSLCRQWRYSIFAYTRHPQTRRIAFRRLIDENHDAFCLKMLFLVPPNLYSEFANLAPPPADALVP